MKEKKKILGSNKLSTEFKQNVEFRYRWNRLMGKMFYSSADYEQATKYLHKSLVIAIKQDDDKWLSTSYNDVGLAAYKSHLVELETALINASKGYTGQAFSDDEPLNYSDLSDEELRAIIRSGSEPKTPEQIKEEIKELESLLDETVSDGQVNAKTHDRR